MWPSVTSVMTVAGWTCVLLAAAVSADSVTKLYKKVGDGVSFRPGSVTRNITNIIWKHQSNLAIEWDGTEIDGYRQFKDRGHLNTLTGELTITGLTRDDSGSYTAEINDGQSSFELYIISPVPTPTVNKTCDATGCTLTCNGNTTGAEPVTYIWKLGDKVETGSKERRITKDSSSLNKFSCELENPVSRESSEPISILFFTTPDPAAPQTTPPDPAAPKTTAPDPAAPDPAAPDPAAPAGNLKISSGLTVFISLLTVVLLLVVIHRWKAGTWFFQKDSMPWEADFWRKHSGPPRDAAESNGTADRKENEQRDEETPMT